MSRVSTDGGKIHLSNRATFVSPGKTFAAFSSLNISANRTLCGGLYWEQFNSRTKDFWEIVTSGYPLDSEWLYLFIPKVLIIMISYQVCVAYEES